ncbi:hypothetical protein ANO11243_053500 [Dothideomycetidae sp. 11243]|nr:hypothetical protein ANO11243_053500 [fungal sp. No.11243]
MTRPVTSRSNSQGRVLLKASRPSALKLSKGAHSHKGSLSSNKGRGKRDSHIESDDDFLDSMAALPNFWKDGSHPVPCAVQAGVPSPPIVLGPEVEDEPFSDIVPQQSPTMLGSSSAVVADFADHSSGPGHDQSEAAKYLSKFMASGNASPGRRSRLNYRNNNSLSHTTLPSLSHTPSSLASPLSSYNSVSRTAPPKITPWGYRHSKRPSFDLSATASVGNNGSLRSEASTETVFKAVEGELTYEKKPMGQTTGGGPCAGSLKQLFAHEAMRRSSALTYNSSSASLSDRLDREEA